MVGIAIVALPSRGEKVYDVSSEKVPHLTLCYLGENLSPEKLNMIVGFVEHAASQLSPFDLSVDYRDTLGPDDADVLFFQKDSWSFPRIASFRSHLLQDNTIRAAYDAVEQYPEWTPHLTLGYPAAPAKDGPDEKEVHYVQFDRIAVWMNDFDGPEFRLQYDTSAASDVTEAAWGEDVANAIFHFGVKGMHWGVRKKVDKDGNPQRSPLRKAITKSVEANRATGDTIRENGGGPLFHNLEERAAFHKAVHDNVSTRISDVNSDPRFKGKDLKYDAALRTEYHNEVKKLAKTAYTEELANARAKLAVEATVEIVKAIKAAKAAKKAGPSEQEVIRLRGLVKDVQHADTTPNDETVLSFDRDELGHIVNLQVMDTELGHYGVKGMHWGVRNGQPSGARTKKDDTGPTPVKVEQTKPGTFAKSTGGDKHPLHPDAEIGIQARQKAKRSTTDALSNDELRRANERLQLEANFNKLTATNDRRSAGARFAAGFFGIRKPDPKVDQQEASGEQIRKIVDDVLNSRKTANN